MQLDPRAHFFDVARGFCLFVADAYEGGQAWDFPSSATLGTATLYGYRVVTVDSGENPGAQQVAETTLGTERSYLVPWPGETLSNFRRRRSLAVYINLTEPIVDAYLDAITPRVTRQLGRAEPYLNNLDGDGHTWSTFVGDVALAAALRRDRVRDRHADAQPRRDARAGAGARHRAPRVRGAHGLMGVDAPR